MRHTFAVALALFGVALSAAYATPPAADSSGPRKARVEPPDRIICRRFIRTGSLVDSYRTCKTRAEWDRERQAIRSISNSSSSCRLIGDGGAC